MNDQTTSVVQLRELVRQFVEARDWQQFHSPKNLSMALAIEAAELMEHFQWLTPEQPRLIGRDSQKLQDVGEELADILCYAMAVANELDIDITTVMQDKMRKNERKYPADEYRGRYGPEDPGEGRRR